VVYPEGLSTLPGAPFFSACFFAMLFFLGIDGEFATVEVAAT
jgi:solute carrier family 6 amino acid transporter-like protein 5/7/9/14